MKFRLKPNGELPERWQHLLKITYPSLRDATKGQAYLKHHGFDVDIERVSSMIKND